MNIFLSFSFGDDDKLLVQQLEALLRSHGVRPVTGRTLDGESVTPAVLKRVESCDALIALMTKRDKIVNTDGEEKWRTHPWVRDEINHARGQHKPAIALLEEGVNPEGAYADNERIALDRTQPLPAFLALSTRLANWKRDSGRPLMAKILPSDLAHQIAEPECRYRFWSEGAPADWCDGQLIPAEGGTLLMVRSVPREDALIEVRVEQHGTVKWSSKAVSQHVTIELSQAFQ